MSDSDGGNDESFPVPQISDVLVLTLCVSFVLALNTPSYHDEFRMYQINWRDLLPVLLDEFVTSLGLFGVIVVVRQAWRHSRSHGELGQTTHGYLMPGHVVLLTMGPYEIVRLIYGVFRPFLWIDRQPALEALEYGGYACLYAVSLVYPVLTIRKFDFRWQVCLYLLVAAIAVAALACVSDTAIYWGWRGVFFRRHFYATIGNLYALLAVAACVAVVLDWRLGKRRDWLHYAGVLALLMHATAAVMHWERTMRLWWGWVGRQLW